jgi:hypothetical protein
MRPRKIIFWMVAGIFLVASVFVAFLLSGPAAEPMPEPNGYHDLFKASQQVITAFNEQSSTPIGLSEYRHFDAALLQTAVNANAEALQIARLGLAKECRIPAEAVEATFLGFNSLVAWRGLGSAFAAEGYLAELEGDFDRAALSYLDLIHLGHDSFRGGLIMHRLIGQAFESIGLNALAPLADKVDAESASAIVRRLREFERKREPAQRTIRFDRHQTWKKEGIRGYVTSVKMTRSLLPWKRFSGRFRSQFDHLRAKSLEVTIAFAARSFAHEHGAPPRNITALVPKYFDDVPRDPLTGRVVTLTWRAPIYRPRADAARLPTMPPRLE